MNTATSINPADVVTAALEAAVAKKAAADAAAGEAEDALGRARVLLGQANRELRDATEAARLFNSDKARWTRATKAIRKAGVRFRSNVQKCCRGCVTAEDLGAPNDDVAVGWTFGGQGGRIAWDEYDGHAFHPVSSGWGFRTDADREVVAWINHSGFTGDGTVAGTPAGRVIAEAFRAEGFEVEWDGTDAKCVEVKFPVRGAAS